jgi:hypothetical protein
MEDVKQKLLYYLMDTMTPIEDVCDETGYHYSEIDRYLYSEEDYNSDGFEERMKLYLKERDIDV